MVLADAVDQEIDFSIKEELVAMIRKMIARGRGLRSITDLLELDETYVKKVIELIMREGEKTDT